MIPAHRSATHIENYQEYVAQRVSDSCAEQGIDFTPPNAVLEVIAAMLAPKGTRHDLDAGAGCVEPAPTLRVVRHRRVA